MLWRSPSTRIARRWLGGTRPLIRRVTTPATRWDASRSWVNDFPVVLVLRWSCSSGSPSLDIVGDLRRVGGEVTVERLRIATAFNDLSPFSSGMSSTTTSLAESLDTSKSWVPRRLHSTASGLEGNRARGDCLISPMRCLGHLCPRSCRIASGSQKAHSFGYVDVASKCLKNSIRSFYLFMCTHTRFGADSVPRNE